MKKAFIKNGCNDFCIKCLSNMKEDRAGYIAVKLDTGLTIRVHKDLVYEEEER